MDASMRDILPVSSVSWACLWVRCRMYMWAGECVYGTCVLQVQWAASGVMGTMTVVVELELSHVLGGRTGPLIPISQSGRGCWEQAVLGNDLAGGPTNGEGKEGRAHGGGRWREDKRGWYRKCWGDGGNQGDERKFTLRKMHKCTVFICK